MDEIYLPSEQDRETIKRFLELAEKDIGRESHDEQGPTSHPDEMYVVVPPCGESIPARQGAVPGQQTCCLFKLVLQGGTNSGVSGFEYELVPVIQPGTGLNVQQTVYNIYDEAISAPLPPNERYLHIKRDKFGKWLVVPPAQFLGAGSTTTTSSGLLSQSCSGNCKWTWNGTCWTTNGCTTSTTSTSSTSSTTTTTVICLCPPVGSTTTSSTTTTCSGCVYPPLCGTVIGQCYHSSCTQKQLPQVSSCSCSTTTTPFCNCNTTSTNGPCLTPPCGGQGDNCGANCVWKWNGTKWTLVYQNCMTCAPPPPGTNICKLYVSYCSPGIFVLNGIDARHAVGGGCFSKCCWCWSPLTNQWKLLDGGFGGTPNNPTCCVFLSELGPIVCHPPSGTDGPYCSGGLICTPPSWTPSVGAGAPSNCGLDDCSTAMLEMDPLVYSDVNPAAPKTCDCSDGTGPTTTTPAGSTTTPAPGGPCNCGFCYTSTTTTTLPPVSGNCLWQCSGPGLTWSLLSNHCACSQSCICNTPAQVCAESCQIQLTNCISNTTTTPG